MVRQIEELGEFQFANALQPFLVAMPEYRKLYNDGMATGYENGFSRLDVFKGNAYMRTDDHFREATSGISTKYDEGRFGNGLPAEDRCSTTESVDKVDIQQPGRVSLSTGKMVILFRTWRDVLKSGAGPSFSSLGAVCSIPAANLTGANMIAVGTLSTRGWARTPQEKARELMNHYTESG
ncbi:hypothetical protein N5V81_14140 [Escherichia coli]|nr:hypothetical protein [Escherichia coli]